VLPGLSLDISLKKVKKILITTKWLVSILQPAFPLLKRNMVVK
jgi:hypothetical protein